MPRNPRNPRPDTIGTGGRITPEYASDIEEVNRRVSKRKGRVSPVILPNPLAWVNNVYKVEAIFPIEYCGIVYAALKN